MGKQLRDFAADLTMNRSLALTYPLSKLLDGFTLIERLASPSRNQRGVHARS